MQFIISEYIIKFIIYSFLGWCWESFFAIIKNGKWEMRGFLIGPICPIYGVCIIMGTIVTEIFKIDITKENWIVLFIFSFFISGVIEYVTSLLLEKLFNASWWDYKNIPLNINGRISIFTSIGFGIVGVYILLYVIPWIDTIIGSYDKNIMCILSYIIVALFFVDMSLTVNELIDLNSKIKVIDEGFNSKMDFAIDELMSRPNALKKYVISKIKEFKHSEKISIATQTVLNKITKVPKKK